MQTFLLYFIQLIIVSGTLSGYYYFFLRNKKFHQYNRFYILSAVVLSMVIPFLQIPVYFTTHDSPAIALQSIQQVYTAEETTLNVATIGTDKSSWLTRENILYAFYLLVTLVCITRMILSLRKIRRMVTRYDSEKIEDIHFINTSEPGTPFSFFKWLFWNKALPLHSGEGQQIFRHEIFHIKEKHSADLVFMEAVTTLFWINPFFHFFKKELKAIHEFLADQYAAKDADKNQYAELLLMQVLQTRQYLVNPFFNNNIKRRIAMLIHPQKTSQRYLRKMLVLPLAILLLALFAFKYKQVEISENALVQMENKSTLVDTFPAKKSSFINTKDSIILEADSIISIPDAENSKTDFKKALLVINGQKETAGYLKKKTIISDRITIISPDDAGAKKYGNEGAFGVIIFEGAKIIDMPPTEYYKELFSEKNKPSRSEELIFEKAEIEAQFPGGPYAWLKYLQRNLDASVPTKKGAPAGNYKAEIQFIVHTDGSISDIKALTSHGYGIEEEAMRVISKGPKWLPAIQNGKNVNTYRRQPITFVVENRGKETAKSTNVAIQLPEVVAIAYLPASGKKSKIEKVNALQIGTQQWTKYFLRNVDVNTGMAEGLTPGHYKFFIEFIVDQNGNISNEKILNHASTKQAQQLLAVIKNIPRVTGNFSGKTYYYQPVTVSIIDDKGYAAANNNKSNSGPGPHSPKVSITDLQSASVHKLLKLDESIKVIGFTFTTDLDNGDIAAVDNNGNELSKGVKKLIAESKPGRIITMDNVRVREGETEKKIPSRLYYVTN